MNIFAKALSYILNPVMLLLLTPFLLVYYRYHNLFYSLKWTVFSSVFLFVLGAFVFYEVRKKVFTDFDVSEKQQRPKLFFVSGILALLYAVSVLFLHGPEILFVSIIGIGLVLLTSSAINTKIKVSGHLATLTAFIFLLILLYSKLWIFALLLLPLLAWSRIKLHRHTLTEVITGSVIGVTITVGLYLLAKIS